MKDMFVGVCTWTSYIFAMFEWQKAFLNIKRFTHISCVSVAQWKSVRLEIWGTEVRAPSVLNRFWQMMQGSRKIKFVEKYVIYA